MKVQSRSPGIIRALTAIFVCVVIAAGGVSPVVANGGGIATVTAIPTVPLTSTLPAAATTPGEGFAPTRPDLDVLDLASAIWAAMLNSPEIHLSRNQLLEAELTLREQQTVSRPAVSLELLEAEHAFLEAQDRFRETLADVAYRTEEAFYRALGAEQLLELQKRRFEHAEAQLAIARARHRAGTLASLDLAGVELDYEQAQAELQDAERRHAAALRALAALTGLDPLPPLAWTEDDFAYAPSDVSLSDVLEHASQAHPDLTSAQNAVRRAERRLQYARIGELPPVQRARSELALERARIALFQTTRRASEEARQLWDEVQSAETTLFLREKRLSLVRQRLRLTQTRHDAGAASWMELFTAETEVFQAQIDASQALWDYNLKKARLLWLAGQGAPLVIPAEYQELLSRGDLLP